MKRNELTLTLLLTGCINCIISTASAQPIISALSSTHGYPGTSITITGTNFNAVPANNLVQFGTIAANVTSATTTSLSVTIPISADYDYISVEDMATHLTGYSDQKFLPTFDTLVYSDSLAFASYVPYWNSLPLNFVFIDDIDRDGKPDFLIAEPGGISVYMYRNASTTGSITPTSLTFGYLRPTPLLTYVQGAALGDMDGDGKPDLALLSIYSEKIAVCRNISTTGTLDTSSFDAGIILSDTANAFGLALSDMDGDGKPDLIFTHTDFYYNQQIGILLNTSSPGSISFSAPFNISTGGWGSLNRGRPVITDIDGDGKPDILVEYPLHAGGGTPPNEFYIYQNTSAPGSLSFAPAVNFATAGTYGLLNVCDVDGDGKPDVMVKDGSLGQLSIYRNVATAGSITSGSLDAPVHIAMPGNFIYDFADMDGDCKPDLITGMPTSNIVSVYHNAATPGSISTSAFVTPISFPVSGITGYITARDIDGDTKPELIAGVANDSIAIFRNTAIHMPSTGVNNTGLTNVSVAPNPANGDITITCGATAAGGGILKIMDIAGRTVYCSAISAGTTTTTVPLLDMTAGIYVVSITTPELTHREQLVIQR